MKIRFLIFVAFVGLISIIYIQTCKKDKTGGTSATITAINCSGVTFSGTAYVSIAFKGTATAPYLGGSGGSYNTGAAISSTGVTGLKVTLQPGTLVNGAGSLIYTITGMPSASGTAIFHITFDGQACNIELTIYPQVGILTKRNPSFLISRTHRV